MDGIVSVKVVKTHGYAVDDPAALLPAQSLIWVEVVVQTTVHHVFVYHVKLSFPEAVPCKLDGTI